MSIDHPVTSLGNDDARTSTSALGPNRQNKTAQQKNNKLIYHLHPSSPTPHPIFLRDRNYIIPWRKVLREKTDTWKSFLTFEVLSFQQCDDSEKNSVPTRSFKRLGFWARDPWWCKSRMCVGEHCIEILQVEMQFPQSTLFCSGWT